MLDDPVDLDELALRYALLGRWREVIRCLDGRGEARDAASWLAEAMPALLVGTVIIGLVDRALVLVRLPTGTLRVTVLTGDRPLGPIDIEGVEDGGALRDVLQVFLHGRQPA